MHRTPLANPIRELFHPFFESGQGQIIGLASPNNHFRDGMPLTLLGRYLSMLETPGIAVEPSRSNFEPAANVILVGAASMFVEPPPTGATDGEEPVCIDSEEFRARIGRFQDDCCFRLIGTGGDRVVRNTVTGEVFRPHENAETGVSVDFGVIRRVYRGAHDNIVVLEGPHRMGTFVATLIATDPVHMKAILRALREFLGLDESLPLEILVKATFQDRLRQGVYWHGAVTAVPLCIVYNRQWAYDLVGDRRWRDQRPWDVSLGARREEPACELRSGEALGLPRLEIEADLRELDQEARALIREILLCRERAKADAEARERVLGWLTAEADRARIVLLDQPRLAVAERYQELPDRKSEIRMLRKQFLMHLAVHRILGTTFRYDDDSVRAYFPRFEGRPAGKSHASQWVAAVACRMHEGFLQLVGPPEAVKGYAPPSAHGSPELPAGYVSIPHSKRNRSYRLCLHRCSLVLRLRL
jgi:hypothetical protein